MILPVWITGTEMDCCGQVATVGQRWSGPSVWLGADKPPWWAVYSTGPEPSDEMIVGMTEFEADVITAGHSHDQPGIVRVGSLDIVVPRPTGTGRQRFRGRLFCLGHQGPRETGFGMHCIGTVRRIRAISFGGEPIRTPGSQQGPVELTTVGPPCAPDYTSSGYAEILLDLEIDD